jgi:hypothetical protein
VEKLEHEHTAEAIADRIAASNHNYIRDFIYGGIDGAVTTFAVVSGVSGAELSPHIVLDFRWRRATSSVRVRNRMITGGLRK